MFDGRRFRDGAKDGANRRTSDRENNKIELDNREFSLLSIFFLGKANTDIDITKTRKTFHAWNDIVADLKISTYSPITYYPPSEINNMNYAKVDTHLINSAREYGETP